MNAEFRNPSTLCPTKGWTHVVSWPSSRTVAISGQVSVDEKGQVVGKGDFKTQVEQVFKNLEHALRAVGTDFTSVVKSNIYVVGLKPDLMPTLREIRARYFNKENPPASTLVGVQALVDPNWLVEIEVIAMLEG